MLENEFYISELIAGRLRGDLNPEQEVELNNWKALSEENRMLFNEFKDEEISKELKHFLSPNRASVWQKTIKGLKDGNNRYDEKAKQTVKSKMRLWLRLGTAAAMFIVVGFAVIFYMDSKRPSLESAKAYTSDVAPGENGATLTLANGKRINLSDAIKGQLVSEAGVTITKTADGQLVYDIASEALQPRNDVNSNDVHGNDVQGNDGSRSSLRGTKQSLNTLSTANGQQYQIILPDHSKVWLNAASSIKYPSSFAASKNRIVELNGEAYFEVAKNKTHPFVVKTTQQKIEVLGTHFNINAYNDGEETKTTLLEGSIQLNGATLLKPNEQGVSNANGISIKTINAKETIAWKQGDFIFKNQELTTTMRQIARWYNVEIFYETGAPKQLRIGGSISKRNRLSVVLKAMEKTGKVKFKLEGRRVIVSGV